MRKAFITIIFSVFYHQAVLAMDSYTVDPRHTFPSFEINHLGFSIQRGRFNQTAGQVMLDPKTGMGNIDITIDTASISTGLVELEGHLRGKDFLDAAQFPKISFVSEQLTFKDKQLIEVDGKLTLHGVTKPVKLLVDHFYCGMNLVAMKNICGANATTTIKRTEFGVSKYAPMLADDVKIEIQIEAIKN